MQSGQRLVDQVLSSDGRLPFLRSSTWIPSRSPVGIREPANGLDHRLHGAYQVREVDSRYFVRWTVVIRVQAETGDRLRDNARPRQSDIIGALKEVLGWVRVGREWSAVTCEFRPQG